jgi:hypothetical protein
MLLLLHIKERGRHDTTGPTGRGRYDCTGGGILFADRESICADNPVFPRLRALINMPLIIKKLRLAFSWRPPSRIPVTESPSLTECFIASQIP